jgi:hypothetical protein
MYEILNNDISYDIATEHHDWGINDIGLFSEYKKPDSWVNLTVYAMLRRNDMEMSAEDFQRKLERSDIRVSRAPCLTMDFCVRVNELLKECARPRLCL